MSRFQQLHNSVKNSILSIEEVSNEITINPLRDKLIQLMRDVGVTGGEEGSYRYFKDFETFTDKKGHSLIHVPIPSKSGRNKITIRMTPLTGYASDRRRIKYVTVKEIEGELVDLRTGNTIQDIVREGV